MIETKIDKDFLLEQLELQAKNFESIGDEKSANTIRNLINKACLIKNDKTSIDVNMTLTLKKFDGEIKPGDEPVETLVF